MSINRPKRPETPSRRNLLAALAAIGITFAATGEVNAQEADTTAQIENGTSLTAILSLIIASLSAIGLVRTRRESKQLEERLKKEIAAAIKKGVVSKKSIENMIRTIVPGSEQILNSKPFQEEFNAIYDQLIMGTEPVFDDGAIQVDDEGNQITQPVGIRKYIDALIMETGTALGKEVREQYVHVDDYNSRIRLMEISNQIPNLEREVTMANQAVKAATTVVERAEGVFDQINSKEGKLLLSIKEIESAYQASVDAINVEYNGKIAQRIKELEGEIEYLEKEINELDGKMEDKMLQIASPVDSEVSKEQILAEWTKMRADKKAKKAQLKTLEKKTLPNASIELEKERDNRIAEIEGIEEKIAEIEKQIAALPEQIASAEYDLNQAETALLEAKNKLDEANANLSQVQSEKEKLTEKASSYEEASLNSGTQEG